MSERTSLSSNAFNRSLVYLLFDDPKAPWFDVDELFSSEEIRRRLAKKLLETRGLKVPSTLEGSEEGTKHSDDVFPPLDDWLSPEQVSIQIGEESIQEESVEKDLTKSEFTAEPESSELTSKPGEEYVQWRVFINCVDTFNPKHIAEFLSDKIQGSSKVEEVEEGGEEEIEEEVEILFGEEEEGEFFRKPQKEETPKMNYEIFGSLLEPDGEYDKEIISEIVETSDLIQLLKTLKTCAFIIYDVSRHPSQVREARWICQTLQYELQLLERWHPETFAKVTHVPVFILISSFMTWARTRAPGPHSEDQFKKRRSHPNYNDHLKLEKEVMAAGKVYPSIFKTMVLCSGLQYGHEEDVLNFLFRLAWENEPELPLYSPPKNKIPMIHIDDLASMVFNILENLPKKRYLLAVEQGTSTIKGITKAISKGLTSGEIMTLPNEQMRLLKLPQPVIDCLSANVEMEPTYFAETGKIEWKYETPFIPNIANIIKEYLESRNLGAKRILVVGPPASGKTILAKKLAGYYQLHYLTPNYVAERSIKTLKEKIEKLHVKELQALEKERLRDEGEEEEDEEEAEEEEEEEEEEEGEKETIESLKEALTELQNNRSENGGVLDEEHLLKCLREMLVTHPLRNQGYVLDGFPNTVRQVRHVFKPPTEGEEEEEEMMEDEEDELPQGGAPFPDYVIGIEASDDFLFKRVMELPEDEIKQNGYEEEKFKETLAAYRKENTDETGVLSYFDERDVHPLLVYADDDNSPDFEDSLQHLKKNLGEPQNFGLSTFELALKSKLEEELGEKAEEEVLTRREEEEKNVHEDRMRKIEQWALVMDALRQEEEDIMEADSLPLRHYLMRYVFPRLTQGLLDLERVRPLDPQDFLAEFLFKENPEGHMFEPEYTENSRQLFQDMLKCRDTLFSLTSIDKEEEEMFFPKDVLEDKDQEYDTYY